MQKILVIDDDMLIRDFIAETLRRQSFDVVTAKDGREGVAVFDGGGYDLVISDIKLPGLNGIEVLKHIKTASPQTIVILMTAYANVETAVESMKLGAANYLKKPFSPEEIELVVEKELEIRRIKNENLSLKEKYFLSSLVGKSLSMKKLYEVIENVAKSRATVLIQGESGTGKELVARAIHSLSERKDCAYITVNCAALPDNLLESELFGYEKGAFTGADKKKEGKFMLADKGTILLDEIGDIPPGLQAKLLRVLQEREVDPIGSKEPIPVDVRVIATTNINLKDKIQRNEFREDLYFRLNVIPILLPPLRERKEDIPLLVRHFLKKYAAENGYSSVPDIDPKVMPILEAYSWPGNVRELENLIERVIVLGVGSMLQPSHIQLDESIKVTSTPNVRPLLEVERDAILAAYSHFNGDKNKTAELLGITTKTLRAKLLEYGQE